MIFFTSSTLNWPGAMGFPNEAYVNGLPKYKHKILEILPKSPIEKAIRLVFPALLYNDNTSDESAIVFALVTILT